MFRLISLVICLFAATPVLAGATYNPEKNADEQIGYWDADGDGAVSLEEFSRSKSGRFHQIDGDHNGLTTLREWLEFRPVKKIVAINLMKRWDANADNVISREEFLQPTLVKFQQIDANHDQLISRQELVDDWRRKKQALDAYWQEGSDEH
ncbi:MAG: hypothetical protein R8K46_04035 [Mariprofundaceae bacterium]